MSQLTLPGYRHCNTCHVVKPLATAFHKSGKRNDKQRYRPRCKLCQTAEYHADSEKFRERKRRQYAANPERARKRDRRYREANPERVKETQRHYYQTHQEDIAQRQRRRREANPGQFRERTRRWYAANPDRLREHNRRHRARKNAATGSFTEAEFQALCDYYENICLCCGESKELERDHVIPLSKGGNDNILNIQPLCKSCNRSKSVKTIDYR